MADGTKIGTPMWNAREGRWRFYVPQNPERPGQQARRAMAAQGKKWCRHCSGWLDLATVGKNGLCRPHENADAQRRYAEPGAYREGRKDHAARRRGVERVSLDAGAYLLELFEGECAYCPAPATTWDHVTPVSAGGITEPRNIVPACRSCNSAKHDLDIEVWLDRAPLIKAITIDQLSHFGMI